ncbi:MAG: adenine nucleotide alpha hydrolase [Planctomycetes bacterium]|nr:adenine nucleotide alpha hydrolase [Planctomycetota bacterium]
MERILLSWSGGKDSLLALAELRASARYDVAALVTTIAEGYERISHHGVRRELLRRQAEALRLPLVEVRVSQNCTNREYEAKLQAGLIPFRERGMETVAFGDIFLQDLRDYREQHLSGFGMRGLFPLWLRDTATLVRDFLSAGYRTVTVCVDGKVLDRSFAGREIDEAFLADLPAAADPCGENGEFHTFVFEGPLLERPVLFETGEIVARDSRYFCDLVPVAAAAAGPAA